MNYRVLRKYRENSINYYTKRSEYFHENTIHFALDVLINAIDT